MSAFSHSDSFAFRILTNRMWFSVICILIDNDTRHHSGQNVVDRLARRSRVSLQQQILTTVMMCIVVDKSTDHAKPHFNLFFPTISTSKKMFFSERELKKALRDT